ncbi:Tat proofreading chaperone DmsD [Vreelandella olivaria]|uniref:Tat proofreading chaperone DmsD n=1 Tax=Vreelandella olivaria TaxID=390919 RepID=UPI00201ECF16|nr:Tat proofreading chaperone DmsD [Halomonas olivaria]
MQSLAHSARLLGAWFYYPPDAPALEQLNQHLGDGSLAEAWPYDVGHWLTTLSEAYRQPLCEEAYQQLFVGPEALAAPPWGSVYLDPEQVVFGDSHQTLKRFLEQEEGISLATARREPLDHFGLLVLLLGQLAMEGREAGVDRLLGEFLLPWSGRYLEQLEEHAPHPFYRALAQLGTITLGQWQTERGITPQLLRLYR